jgi:hypothetical protein
VAILSVWVKKEKEVGGRGVEKGDSGGELISKVLSLTFVIARRKQLPNQW